MEIGIGTVMSEINTSYDGLDYKPFSISWVRISGLNKGQVKTVQLASKYSKAMREPSQKASPNLRENLLIRIQDETGKVMDIFIPSIVSYNGATVKH